MGFLHKLWDETLAGPTPEVGLGKLRKYDYSFSSSSSSSCYVAPPPAPGGRAPPPPLAVTRSITIARSNRFHHSSGVLEDSPHGSPDINESPLSSTTPGSPSTPESPGGGGGGRYNQYFHSKRMARRTPFSSSSHR